MGKMNPVVHFEMPAEDKKRMMDFYSNVFGWHMQEMGEDMRGYVVAHTGETDDKTGMVKNPGMINGGFYMKRPDKDDQPSVVIAVDNIEDHVKKITEAGGDVFEGPMDIPGIGKYASFRDTEGNKVSVLQASRSMEEK